MIQVARAKIFGNKADTYEKRYKRAVSKLQKVSEMVSLGDCHDFEYKAGE